MSRLAADPGIVVNPAQWRRISELLADAHQRRREEREAYVRRCLTGDPDLLDRALLMLAAMDDADHLTGRIARSVSELGRGKELRSGTRVGGFVVDSLIARGGMGRVYLAYRDSPDYRMKVALKMIEPQPGNRARAPDASELQILASLNHPNIARLIDGGIDTEYGLYLATEFVDGRSLAEAVRDPLFSRKDRLRCFMRICDAVHHAHQKLVLHCDIKPANIVLDADGRPKLLDFGVAAVIQERSPSTLQRVRALSGGYASPEQFRGEPLSTRTDIYSLGLVLYELVTGTPAISIDDREFDEWLNAHEAFSQRRRRTEDQIEQVAEKACNWAPESRYSSAGDLASDVGRVLEHRPVGQTRLPRRIGLLFKRNPLSAALGLVVLMVSAMASWAVLDAWQQARSDRDRLLVEREAKSAANEFLAQTLTELDAISTDSSLLTATLEFLNMLASRAERELTEAPDAQAEVMRILGDALHTKGEFEQAQALLLRALTLYETSAQPYTEERAQTHLLLALSKSSAGDYDSARVHLDTTKSLLGELPNSDTIHHAQLALVEGARARILGDFEVAERFLVEAVQRYQEIAGANSHHTAHAMDSLGYLYLYLGKAERAAPLLAQARETTRSALGERHVNYGRQTSHLATTLRELGRLPEARELYPIAVANLAHNLGADHSYVINARTEFGRVLQNLRDFKGAQEQFERSLASSRRTFGDMHYQTGIQLQNIAALAFDLGETESSGSAYSESLEILTQTLPPDNVFIGAALIGQAMVDIELERLQSAVLKSRQALAIFSASVGDSHWYFDFGQCVLALALKLDEPRTSQSLLDKHLRAIELSRPNDFRVGWLKAQSNPLASSEN